MHAWQFTCRVAELLCALGFIPRVWGQFSVGPKLRCIRHGALTFDQATPRYSACKCSMCEVVPCNDIFSCSMLKQDSLQ